LLVANATVLLYSAFQILATALALTVSVPCGAAQNAWSKLLGLPDAVPLAAPPLQIVSDLRSGHIYVVVEGADLYRTVDRGVTWAFIPSRGNLSGGTTAVALDPLHAGTVYRINSLGVFKSVNGGKDWNRMDRNFAAPPLALAVAPNAMSTIYVGLGIYCGGGTCGEGGGIMKSEDGGNSWSPAGLEGLGTVIIVPDDRDTLYAVASSGGPRNVYKSSDGGRSWSALFGGDVHVTHWVLHPHEPQTIYMTALVRFFRLLFRSTNGGTTWNVVRPVIDGYRPPECPPDILDCTDDPLVRDLIIDPRHAGTFYAVDGRTVIRSSDNGKTWQYVTGLPEPSTITALILDGDTLLAGVWSRTPGTTGVYEYTFTPPPPLRRRTARR
jgi:hypothetical protein